MKKFFYTFYFIIFTSAAVFAQIPNASFESWSNGEPTGWFSNNITQLNVLTITQSSDAQSGSSAAKIAVANYLGIDMGPVLWVGSTTSPGFKVTQRYGSLSGYYKFSPVLGDVLSVAVTMSKNGTTIGSGLLDVSAAASSYTPFSVNIKYAGSDVPDTCNIYFVIAWKDTSQSGHSGSYALIDNLSLSAVTGVAQANQPISYKLYQNYPNPFNPSTTIEYQIPRQSFVKLKVYDVLGNEVSELVNREEQAGNYKVNFDASKLSSGVYFYELQAGSFTQVKKLILTK